ncbi:hypothetical protein B9Z19DRAFT_1120572 [Tuber borchii]|uniref:Uncharacterized protein n=1 Tax=Tuber borchii TaxID=42251 RepID=A0A2T7A468_TUBBO|nr:hypothetical protein B9Z19DRAFT_1120572 [Tuber borchii]
MSTGDVSHGRGGMGNIGPDETEYIDGEIVRTGDPTSAGGAYSAGRGGAGNIGAPQRDPVRPSMDEDVVPSPAKVQAHENEGFHSGRGGEGNAHLPEGEKKNEGLAERLKRKILGWRK